MPTAEFIAVVVGIVSIILLVLQVNIAAKALREDHLRRRQQATLDYLVRDVRPHWRDSLRNAASDIQRSQEALQESLGTENPRDPSIANLLGSVEHMSVGVNIGVYDIAVLDRASGRFIIRIYRQFLPYIKSVQANTPTAYIEFEQVVRDICRRRSIEVPVLEESSSHESPSQVAGATP